MRHPNLTPFAHRACSAIAMFTLASWTLIAATFLAWAPARDALGVGLSEAATRVLPLDRSPGSPAGAAIELASSTAAGYSYSTEDEEAGFSWTVSDGDGDVVLDDRSSRRHGTKRTRGEPYFEFRENGTTYVVHDPAFVAEAVRASAPLREVGRKMGAVGGEMGRHGAAMGRIGGRMGALGARIGMIEARLAARSASAQSRTEMRAEADELREELSRLGDALDERRSEHASRQRELSRQMSELSARHQRVLREVRAEIREIARRALREGKAERPHANA